MGRVIFVDPDKLQLSAFADIVAGRYDYTSVWWPMESAKLFSEPAPELFVCNLYIPESIGITACTTDVGFSDRGSRDAVQRLERRSDNAVIDGASLHHTAQVIDAAFEVLVHQRSSLGYSANHGLALLRKLRRFHPVVPVVFYSQVIASDDALSAIRDGAADVICLARLPHTEILARLDAAVERNSTSATPNARPTATPPSELSGGRELRDTPFEVDRWLGSGAKTAESWFGAITKFIGIGTAILTFLLTAGKLLAWYHEMVATHAVSSAMATSRTGTIAVLVGWYLVVYFLFVTGGVLQRLFREILKGAFWLAQRVPRLKKLLSDEMVQRTTKSVPELFDTAWDSCVVILAVVPALRYTVTLIARASAG